MKEEYAALIKYVQLNKAADQDWFTISSNKEGTHWSGKCWYIHNLLKYEFDLQFDIPVTYPVSLNQTIDRSITPSAVGKASMRD